MCSLKLCVAAVLKRHSQFGSSALVRRASVLISAHQIWREAAKLAKSKKRAAFENDPLQFRFYETSLLDVKLASL